MKSDIIDAKANELVGLSERIWEFAEPGFQENESAELLAKYMERNGFKVTRGVAGMPSAFIAEYGTKKPVIAYLGEYDALPGLSQKIAMRKDPLYPDRPGHGCGHNQLGVGAIGAALLLKEAIASGEVEGSVRYYGCPAEELLAGKVFLVRDGCFKGVDCAMTWHPGEYNGAWGARYTCLYSVKFHFHGRTAHAAGDPHNGRSALDAVELMNIGTNYLREHVTTDIRIHYVTTNGGAEPNVVPAEATVWYYIRAPRGDMIKDVYRRVIDCAEGAAKMTETNFDTEFITGCYNVYCNDILESVLFEALHEIGAPKFVEEDYEFARKLAETYPENIAKSRKKLKETYGIDADDKFLCDFVLDKVIEKGLFSPGSTDVGDVSHVVPTYQIYVAGQGLGSPGHSWQMTAYSGMHIGAAGMLTAAKILGLAGIKLLNNPELVDRAWKFFRENKDEEYVTPLPMDMKPKLNIIGQ